MNYTITDAGETVITVGASGSLARARCEWPRLINALTSSPGTEEGTDVAHAQMLHEKGVATAMDAAAILEAAGFAPEGRTRVCAQLNLIREYEEVALRDSVAKPPRGPTRDTALSPAPYER